MEPIRRSPEDFKEQTKAAVSAMAASANRTLRLIDDEAAVFDTQTTAIVHANHSFIAPPDGNTTAAVQQFGEMRRDASQAVQRSFGEAL
jgi:hypothetical protein